MIYEIRVKANVVHADLNPCGGAERVAVATIQALIEMGLDVQLTTARAPRVSRLRNAFGCEKIDRIFNRIERIDLFDSLLQLKDNHDGDNNVITINTHGDMLPYYLPHFTRTNAITYCHYPMVTELVEQHDLTYANYLMNLGLISKRDQADIGNIWSDNSLFWRTLQENYLMMLKNSTIITNSTFSKDAILRLVSRSSRVNSIAISDPLVIPPPVNVEELCNEVLASKEREDFIVVISRFNPSKKLENAIILAHMLKKQNIAKGMIIVGGLMPEDREYYSQIVNMVKTSDLLDYVRLEINVTSDMLKSILRKAKVYFHSMPEEPFGISIAEAMSAGLIPIVPSVGGHTDFTSEKYAFSSLQEAAAKISSALRATQEERKAVSEIVNGFSETNYIISIQKVIRNLLQKPNSSTEMSKYRTTVA